MAFVRKISARMVRVYVAKELKQKTRQIGIIMAGGGINYQRAVADAIAQGHRVELHKGHARIFSN